MDYNVFLKEYSEGVIPANNPHGVGFELDEFPVFAKGLFMELEKGMTFALEPEFVFPDGDVAWRTPLYYGMTELRS